MKHNEAQKQAAKTLESMVMVKAGFGACRAFNQNGMKLPRKTVETVSYWHLQMCFAPQLRALFRFLQRHRSPHPPLYRAYPSTTPDHKTIEKHSISCGSMSCPYMSLLTSVLFSSSGLLTATFQKSEVSLLSFKFTNHEVMRWHHHPPVACRASPCSMWNVGSAWAVPSRLVQSWWRKSLVNVRHGSWLVVCNGC